MDGLIRFFYFLYRPILLLFFALNTAILGGVVFILCCLDPTGNTAHYIGKFWARMNLYFSGVLVSVEGGDHINREKSYIIMSNHQSHYDVLALIAYMPLQLRWVMKLELREIPIFGYCCERMGQIYIDRGHSEKAHESLKIAGEKIRNGSSVVFFPEGTRSPDGKLLPFKKGGFIIAMEAKVPILPVTVVGGRNVVPKGSLRILPGRMKIIIHEPISVDGYSYDRREELVAQIRGIIEEDLE
ncbi:MAG: 1-acyl-sn-glycerol-3-phosphate acyltransferase [Deltaproteobacteria bacterium]|nr:1-acyl-sn-glycerol-3-phosphate acyltransferase [Deltaproteobacteria bacterium]